MVSGRVLQHAAALAMAELARSMTDPAGTAVRLIAQDPFYSPQANQILGDAGFEVVGEFGARAFAEVDDNSIVFTAYINAPATQIVADLARPAAIICAPRMTYDEQHPPQ